MISFNIEGIHPYDIGTIVDKLGIAVRTGQHCTQPIMNFFNISGTVRASFAFYNTIQEIDIFVAAVEEISAPLIVITLKIPDNSGGVSTTTFFV